MSAASDEQAPERPGNRLALLVAGLVAIEAVLLLAGAVVLLVEVLTSDRDNVAAALTLVVIVVIVGIGLAACVRAVAQGRRWTRGPLLTWQLLQAGVGMPLSTTRAWWAGVPLLAAAIVVGVLLVGRHVITEPSDPAGRPDDPA
jgi:Na+-driven multidrug efflux pump